jgi:putative mRNA 3-end processing factor
MDLNVNPLLCVTDVGLFCEQGGFFIDPWRPVDRAVVTHAHADHLCRGCGSYLVARDGLRIARARLDESAPIETVEYGEPSEINGVRISLHPAGHILGSAQIRVEHRGQVWVVSGDYKTDSDRSCQPFEPIRCHVFVSECTFGLPVYRWPAPGDVFAEILQWWQSNLSEGRASLLYAYSLGKAQRVLAGFAQLGLTTQDLPGSIYTHGAVEVMNRAYRETGIALPPTTHVAEAGSTVNWSTSLVVAPPSAHGTPWSRRFGPASAAFASGWMRLRGTRRRRAVDHGFVLSDHVDWPALLTAIDATGAETVLLTHGYTSVVTRWLREQGKNAHAVTTHYEGERDDAPASVDDQSREPLPPVNESPAQGPFGPNGIT